MKAIKIFSVFCLLFISLSSCNKSIEEDFTYITADELYNLFTFDKQHDVYENIESLNIFKQDKQYVISGKKIVFSTLKPDNVDALNGEFSLFVAGRVNNTPFEEMLYFKGFVPKTSNDEEGGSNENDDNVGGDDNTDDNSEEELSVSEEELRSLFVFDISQTVATAIADLELFYGERKINGKQLYIENISVSNQDAKAGTFTIFVIGNINNKKNFEMKLSFSGFASENESVVEKPTDYNMAQRASIKITQGKNVYDLDFDAFYRENKIADFALQLKEILTITSSNNDGLPYTYTEEDMQNTSLADIRYERIEKKVYFKLVYNGYTSPDLFITFDNNEYYKRFVTVNKAEVSKYYQSGILHYTDETGSGGYLFSQFVVALDGFKVEYQSYNKDGQNINYSVKLLSPDYQELALFDVLVTGFKDLHKLKDELIISGGNYSDYIRDRLKNNNDIEGLIKNSFNNNIASLSFNIDNVGLTYNHSGGLLSNEEEKTLFFEEVIIEYHSIVKDKDGGITLNVRLSSVNGVILDDVIPINHFLLKSDLQK